MAQKLHHQTGPKVKKEVSEKTGTFFNAYHMVLNLSWMKETNYKTSNPTVLHFMRMMTNPKKAVMLLRQVHQSPAMLKEKMIKYQIRTGSTLGPCWHCQEPDCTSISPQYVNMPTVEAVDQIYNRLKEYPNSIHACRTLLNCPLEYNQVHRLLYHHPLYTPAELRKYRELLVHELKQQPRPPLLDEEEEQEPVTMVIDDLHSQPMMLESSDLLEFDQPCHLSHQQLQTWRDTLGSPRDKLRERRRMPSLMMRSIQRGQVHPCEREPPALTEDEHRILVSPVDLVEDPRLLSKINGKNALRTLFLECTTPKPASFLTNEQPPKTSLPELSNQPRAVLPLRRPFGQLNHKQKRQLQKRQLKGQPKVKLDRLPQLEKLYQKSIKLQQPSEEAARS